MTDSFSRAHTSANAIIKAINTFVAGDRTAPATLVAALAAGGHALIEGVPGVGKTTLARALAKATGLTFIRAQFTPDLTASDITGYNMWNRETNSFDFHPGTTMTNIMLADEVNRAAPKTQSALLEAMESRTVSVDGTTYRLPRPFIVVATQNEVGFVGTYPLSEAQLDRFIALIPMSYPSQPDERALLKRQMGGDAFASGEAEPAADKAGVANIIAEAAEVRVEDSVYAYIQTVCAATREHKNISLGASTRGALLLARMAKAMALVAGRDYLLPDDVQAAIPYVLPHRLILTRDARLRGGTAAEVLDDAIKHIKPPLRR